MLKKLKKQEKSLNTKSDLISSTISKKQAEKALSWRLISKMLKCLTPFRILIGFACLSVSLLVVGSIAITNFDRLMNSECGLKCGYVIEKYHLFNPLDFILVELSKYYPLDFILFAMILFFMFITCIYGLVRLGIKFLCFNVSFCTNLCLALFNKEKRNFPISSEYSFCSHNLYDVFFLNAIALNSSLIHNFWFLKTIKWRGIP